ncbi:MAG: heme NO-binding domain-containing protein [Bacteroidota bacterium]
MKGIVFTEFLELVEDQFGYDIADDLLEQTDLPSGGVYTAVGTYHHSEIIALVVGLSKKTGIEVAALVEAFGTHLFGRFVEMYPIFFEGITNTLDFLRTIDRHIHVEVRKLYPDASLPRFTYEEKGDDELVMIYESERPFADLARGLIKGCAAHYGEDLDIHEADESTDELTRVRFTLVRTHVTAAA